ncbi:uncharacterized protein KY384_006553 [Bacidia gigantensis]|uniref:uncharacterized protein n=1 Tax=Bacidia gigantensis TaxID=2732470 RepID=UPI001D050E0E|nr:uncharacterized protein KY384_006553 [Bacidia gigantensis]KAG8528864.1 hypothetical protein KY384_006553 [Bacidia gigantensis]
MAVDPTASVPSRSVYLTLPPLSILKFNPFNNPEVISPPVRERSIAQPFNISPEAYAGALNVAWPVVIATAYAVAVTLMNRKNAERSHKPWAFSKSAAFYFAVIAHNVFLALYSLWTFSGMIRAIRNSWPGVNGAYGLAGAADALCKMHGPRGPGSAAIYDMATQTWGISDVTMNLEGGNPDTTDVGRLWNEGLAYYGWIFYLSKFYEVVDSFIILAKGKNTSFLQTFHHTGAMFAMWSGIRYMSPPIWMFTCLNSLIHFFMYTYYTLAALGIRVPFVLKRGLTAAQIFQIVFGASYAFAHLFVAYDVPSWASYSVLNNLSTAIPNVASTASNFLSSATAAADFGSLLKKAALRAAGEEGLAANVRNYKGETFGIDAIHAAESQKALEEIVYKQHITRAHCLDTSGESFAILFNICYLAPLAGLFISFFAQYFQQSASAKDKTGLTLEDTKFSASKATTDVKKQIAEAMSDPQGGATEPPEDIKKQLENAKDKTQQKAKKAGDQAKEGANKVSAKAKDAVENVRDKAPNVPDKAKERGQDAINAAKNAGENAKNKVSEYAQAVKGEAKQKADEANEEPGEVNSTPVKGEPIEEKGAVNGDIREGANANNEEPAAGPAKKEEVEEVEKADSEDD